MLPGSWIPPLPPREKPLFVSWSCLASGRVPDKSVYRLEEVWDYQGGSESREREGAAVKELKKSWRKMLSLNPFLLSPLKDPIKTVCLSGFKQVILFTFLCSANHPPPRPRLLRVGRGGGLLPLRTQLRLRDPRPGFFSPRRLRAGAGGAAGVGAGGAGPGAGRAAPPCGGL